MRKTTRKFVLGLSVAMALVAAGRVRAEGLKIEDIKDPDKATAMAHWTPAQQYIPAGGRRETWGMNGRFGVIVMADMLGDKLTELGRASILTRCFDGAHEDASAALVWAVCGRDVKAFDIKKAEAELDAETISADAKQDFLKELAGKLEKAKKVGAAVEAAAKDDPGIAQIVKLADQGQAEWQKYLAKNKAAFARFVDLVDAVRSQKSNHKNFQGCWEATQPAFAKLVKATKFDYDADRDLIPTYVNTMLTGTENYITVAAFGACAYSVHESGEVLADAILNDQPAGIVRVGPRTMAVALAFDPKLKPKFADRSIKWGEYGMLRDFSADKVSFPGAKRYLSIMTPNQGVVGKVTKNGDMLEISFKGDKVEACLQWVDTKQIDHYSAGGDPQYKRVCKKRGMVDNQEENTPVFAKFAAGIAPGLNVLVVDGYPATVYNKKFVSVLGFPTSN